jgi:hypothetical protein
MAINTQYNSFFDPMYKKAHKQLLAYACGRQVSCRCGQILDVSNACMIETDLENEYVGIYCGDCFDESIQGNFPQYRLKVLDGRNIDAGYVPVLT